MGTLFAMKEIVCREDPAIATSSKSVGVSVGHEELEELENEIMVLSSLSHKHIVRYMGARRDGMKLNIFMEYEKIYIASTLP